MLRGLNFLSCPSSYHLVLISMGDDGLRLSRGVMGSGSTVDNFDGDDERRGGFGEGGPNDDLTLYAEEAPVRKHSASFWNQFKWRVRLRPVLTFYAYVTIGPTSFSCPDGV